MPYEKVEDLPDKIRNVLPLHAQEIFRSSFNNAYDEYKDKEKRRDPHEGLDAICHKVAWTAVKKKYHKNQEGRWVEKTTP